MWVSVCMFVYVSLKAHSHTQTHIKHTHTHTHTHTHIYIYIYIYIYLCVCLYGVCGLLWDNIRDWFMKWDWDLIPYSKSLFISSIRNGNAAL